MKAGTEAIRLQKNKVKHWRSTESCRLCSSTGANWTTKGVLVVQLPTAHKEVAV